VGALLTTWVTFVPCFLFIFLLALYFAVHTLFATSQPVRWGPLRLELPELASLRPVPLAITFAALVMVFRLRWSVPRTLLACAGLGLAAALIGLPVS
jgi:chromate transporter